MDKLATLVDVAMAQPKRLLWGIAAISLVAMAGMVRLDVDTDPESMLPADNADRIRNSALSEDFDLNDLIVVGIVADDTILTPERLSAVADLESEIATIDGVVAAQLIGLSTAADVSQLASPADVDRVASAVAANPLLADNVISADQTTAALFVPLQAKDDATGVAADIEDLIAADPVLSSLDTFQGGLPLAEEEFSKQMFIQMGLYAPMAGLLIFVLMLVFFRSLSLVGAAMIQAMVAVIFSMGLLMGTGNSLHIMSSMIPIFLMPIAILDSIHVLSEFFDRYPSIGDRRETLRSVYRDLIAPITYTSLTTAVAFGSLALTDIPPVRVFGIFIAVGVFAAWALTLMFIPAYVMLISEERLQRTIAKPRTSGSAVGRAMTALGSFTLRRRGVIVAAFAVGALAAIPGLTQIEVNDNPVRWFKADTEVRQATDVLNDKLPGTFSANFVLEAGAPDQLLQPDTVAAVRGLETFWTGLDVVGATASYAQVVGGTNPTEIAGALDQARSAQGALIANLITPDSSLANVRLQMNNGDNQAMREVIDRTDVYLAENPLPSGLAVNWTGETHLNMVWQDEIAKGMVVAFLSTLVVVVVLMALLFRSVRWALLGILPVLWTVLVLYGVIGYVGKDFDAPIAILSTLMLGIGVDFAIHFVQRYRDLHQVHGSAPVALRAFFEEPARALTRNALIIAVGFVPLFLASLVPYLVTGALMSTIMIFSWLATILVLPALVALVDKGPETTAPERSAGSR